MIEATWDQPVCAMLLKEQGSLVLPSPSEHPDGFIGRSLAQIGDLCISQGECQLRSCAHLPTGPSQDAAGAGDGPALPQPLLELLLLGRQHLHPLLQLAQLHRPLLRRQHRNSGLS